MNSCTIVLRNPNLRLHWAGEGDWFASRGYEIWRSPDEGASWALQGALRTGLAGRLARYPLLADAARLGIHNLLRLQSGTLVAIADGTVFRSTDGGVSFRPAFSGFRGRRPLRMGLCQDPLGRTYLGEYWLNKRREAVRLWRSDDDACTWLPVHTWPAGSIRHVHFVQYDCYADVLWIGTGDENHECQIACSRDGGASLEPIGSGTQRWRAVSLLFTPEALIWATDIGIDHRREPNYIMRWERSTGALQSVLETGAPAYYSAQMADGTLVIGTVVEQEDDEQCRRLHLFWSRNHADWDAVHLWLRWVAPGVFGPAMLSFPRSDRPLQRLLFNADGIRSRQNGGLFEAVF